MSREMTSVYVEGQLLETIESMAAESKHRDDVPEVSKSEIKRRWLWTGYEQDDELGDLLSEEERILLEREQFIDSEGKLTNYRAGFRKRVAQQFKERFEGGWNGDELDQFAENMVRDAQILWPEWSDEDYTEDREEAISYVEALVSEAKEARDQSTYDPLSPDEVFSYYEGVEEGVEQDRVEEVSTEVVFDVLERLEPGRNGDAIVRAVAKRHGVSEDAVRHVIDEVRDGDGDVEFLDGIDDSAALALEGVTATDD